VEFWTSGNLTDNFVNETSNNELQMTVNLSNDIAKIYNSKISTSEAKS
jgi:hypothetical protein